MSTQSVAPIDGATYFGVNAAKPKSKLDMDSFIRLLTVQLSNQNPMEPMNDRDFFAQMAQLGQVQGLDKVKDSVDVQKAQSLIGKEVTAVRNMSEAGSQGKNALISGIGTKLTIRDGEYYLGIREADGGIAEVKLDNLRSIAEAPQGVSTDFLGAANLIGTEVSWSRTDGTTTTTGTGIVKSIGSENGRLRATVTLPDGKTTQVSVSDFTKVGLPS